MRSLRTLLCTRAIYARENEKHVRIMCLFSSVFVLKTVEKPLFSCIKKVDKRILTRQDIIGITIQSPSLE